MGVVIIVAGAIYQPFTNDVDLGLGFTSTYWQTVATVFVYSLVGVVLLNVSRIIVDKLALYQFSTSYEIVDQQNAGTGAVEAGVYIATSLIIAGSITGEGGGPLVSLAFIGLGLVALMLFVLFYEFTTSFNIHDRTADTLRWRG